MTDRANEYSYFQIDGSEFNNDIHISFSKFSGHSDEKWELVIGGWSGFKSVVRLRNAASNVRKLTKNHSKTLFDSIKNDIRVYVTDGELLVRGESYIFIQYRNSLIKKNELRYLLVSGGFGGHGTYKIFGFADGGNTYFLCCRKALLKTYDSYVSH